jgi:pyruvate carboxylase
VGEPHADGSRTVFFELNGQPRSTRAVDRSLKKQAHARVKADPDNPMHIAAPMPGKIGAAAAAPGQSVAKGDKLFSIEAMKMETAVYAPFAGKVKDVLVRAGAVVDARDLLMILEPQTE